jgi:hypothetical protein
MSIDPLLYKLKKGTLPFPSDASFNKANVRLNTIPPKLRAIGYWKFNPVGRKV